MLNGRLLPQSNDSPASSDTTNGQQTRRQTPSRGATTCRPPTDPWRCAPTSREEIAELGLQANKTFSPFDQLIPLLPAHPALSPEWPNCNNKQRSLKALTPYEILPQCCLHCMQQAQYKHSAYSYNSVLFGNMPFLYGPGRKTWSPPLVSFLMDVLTDLLDCL